MEPSDRPAKRPRLKGPDGFHVAKNRLKFPCKPHQSFISSFDTHKPEKSTNTAHHFRSLRECPRNLFTTKLPHPGGASLEAKGKQKAFVHPLDHFERLEPSTSANDERHHVPTAKHPSTSDSLSTHSPESLRQKLPSVPLQRLKPPSFVISTPTNAASSSKPSSFSILRPPSLPQPSTKGIALKPLAPPTIEPSFLKKPFTNMKAISSFATDPTKDGAGAELLSLFLQQHGHNFVSPFDCEMQRGIGLSPRKNKSAKGKFKRGGLAERVQHLISYSKTDYTLWQRQLEQTLSSTPAPQFLSYDMRFRILRVLPLPTKTPTPTGVHLAICRVSSRHKLATVGELTDQCYVMLFPQLAGPSRDFEEGRDVFAWKPWFKVVITNVVPREILEALSVEPLMPPRTAIIAPRWHLAQAG